LAKLPKAAADRNDAPAETVTTPVLTEEPDGNEPPPGVDAPAPDFPGGVAEKTAEAPEVPEPTTDAGTRDIWLLVGPVELTIVFAEGDAFDKEPPWMPRGVVWVLPEAPLVINDPPETDKDEVVRPG
jgi:hypothetical protein